MKKVTIFGSTGSIGISSLDVIRSMPGKFKVAGLAANSNVERLKKQAEEFKPDFVAVCDPERAGELGRSLGRTKVLRGEEGLLELAADKRADIVIMAICGSAALRPLLAALEAGIDAAVANKESLVMAGDIVVKRARESGAKIIPVDSEHSAIFQCLNGHNRQFLKKIYLTGSGGPLRKMPGNRIAQVKAADAVRHPKWKMGKKISVDSATLMNKGLEVLEAKALFGVPADNIEVLIHPEAIIHSMVEFIDGSVIAQMGITDMRLPIQYALTYPEREKSGLNPLDFVRLKRFTFDKPNFRKFPALMLAYEAAAAGGTMPAVLNAANEQLVRHYINGKIKLTDIVMGVKKVMKKHKIVNNPTLDDILAADAWARGQIEHDTKDEG